MDKIINIKDSVLIVLAAMFALNDLWSWSLPISEENAKLLVDLLYNLVLVIIGILGARITTKIQLIKQGELPVSEIKKL